MDCHYGRKVLHLDNRRLEYDSTSGNISNITHAKSLHLFHELPTVLTTNISLPVISELVMYNWSETKSHISLNSIYESMHAQAQIMADLSVTPNQPNSKVHVDTKTYASQITSVGLFGFLHGQTVHTNQIWVFLCCIFVTVYGCYVLLRGCFTIGTKVRAAKSRELPIGFIAALQRNNKSVKTTKEGSNTYELDNMSPELHSDIENGKTRLDDHIPTFKELNESLQAMASIPNAKSYKPVSPKTIVDAHPDHCSPLLEHKHCPYPLQNTSCDLRVSPSAPPQKTANFSDQDTSSESSDYVRYLPKAKGFAYIHTNSKAANVNKSIVKIMINGQEKLALIDTGADLTLLTMKAAFILGIKTFDKPEQGGRGLGGDLEILGCANIDIKVGDRKVKRFKTHVANLDLPYDLLLGTDCMEELGAFVIQVTKGRFHMTPFLSSNQTSISPMCCDVHMNKPLKVKANFHACVSVPVPLSGCDTLFLPDNSDQSMPLLLKKVVDKGEGFVSICAINLTDSDHVIPKHYKVGTAQFISNIPEQQ
mgnify:FL=1